MGFFDYFRKEKEKFQPDPVDLLDNNGLQVLIDNILSKVESLVIIKAEGFLDKNKYECSQEDFDFIKKNIEKEGLNIEFLAGQYTISRTIKNTNGTVTNILRQFEFIEK